MNDRKDFFQHHAHRWDGMHQSVDHRVIEIILNRLAINAQHVVLDVAAGTGILTEHLLLRQVTKITAVDYSPNMVSKFSEKFPQINILTADYEQPGLFPGETFDQIFIFNAFPHFAQPQAVFNHSKTYLKPGGKLVIAHSMTREAVNKMHGQAGDAVKDDLVPADPIVEQLYTQAGFTDISLSNSQFFMAVGIG